MKSTKFAVLVLVIALVAGVFAGSASAETYKTKLSLVIPSNASWLIDEAYVLTVPADLTIKASGWNSLGAIHVEHATNSRDHFDPDKKLVVTVTASNDYKLTSGKNTIGYTFGKTKGASDKSFEFTAASIDAGASIDVGITVDDYTGKPAGTYEDVITYKIAVEDAATTTSATLEDALINDSTVTITLNTGSCTFTNSNGAFSIKTNNVSGALGARLEVNGSNLVAKFAYTTDGEDGNPDYDHQDGIYTITFDTDNNTYSQVVGQFAGAVFFNSISINGTEVTNLKKQGS